MKIVKLAIIFVCCVIGLVGILYIPKIIQDKDSRSPHPNLESTIETENSGEEPIRIANSENIEDNDATINMEEVAVNDISIDDKETSEQSNKPISEEEALARHIALKKETERKLLSLLNSGKYAESEEMCKAEWSLNKYYVDVKSIRKILTSDDKNLRTNFINAGIIDSKGILTDDYKLKTVNGIVSLKSKISAY